MLIPNEMALASHVAFVRKGDAFAAGIDPDGNPLGAGVVSVNAIPAANDASWIDIDVIENWEDNLAVEKKTVYMPVPNGGHLVRKRVIPTKRDLNTKFTTGQMSPLAIELFYATASKLDSNSGQFNPLTAGAKEGFLKIQRYSEEDALILAADLWMMLEVTGGMKGGDGNLIMPEFEGLVNYSPLNSMFMGE